MYRLAVILGFAAQGAVAEVPRVAVDITPVHSIVAAVMGDLGQPDVIVPPGASPHGYSMRPSEARALDEADMVVWMGAGLAPWLDGPIDSLADQATVIDLMAHPDTFRLDIREGATFAPHDHDHGHEADHEDDHDEHEEHEGHDDHAKHEEHADHEGHDDHEEHADHEGHDDHDTAEDHAGHDHADHDEKHDEHGHEDEHGHDDHAAADDTDPHAWLDPDNAVTWAGAIADQLAEMDPDNAQTYRANAAAFTNDISKVSAEIEVLVSPVRGRPFVVFHDAYHYFEHHFDIEAVGAVSSTDAVAPSPARLSELREEITELGAVCALTEPQFNAGILNALGDVNLGTVDPIGAELEVGADLYGQLILNMATSLSNCLK